MLKYTDVTSVNSDTISPLIDNVDLAESCIVLRDAVMELTGTARSLSDEVRTLKEKVSQLERQLQDNVNSFKWHYSEEWRYYYKWPAACC